MRWMMLAAIWAVTPAMAAGLSEALEAAWQRQPLARAAASREAALEARAEAARSPTAAPVAVSLGNLGDRLASRRGRDEWELELALPLWLPGQQAASQDVAALERGAATAEARAARWELAGQLREAWWQAAALSAEVALAERRRDTAGGLEADVARRYRAGDLARVDANLAGDERLRAEAALAEARLALAEALEALRRISGSPPPGVFEAEAERPPPGQHPRLQRLLAARELAQGRLRLAQHSGREAPELALRVVRERGDAAEPYANAIGLRLRLPLSSEPRRTAVEATARAEVLAGDAELELARQAVEQEVTVAQARRSAAAASLDRAEARRQFAGDNLALAEKAFALGELDLAALLRARERAFEADFAAAAARTAAAAAVSRLNQARGALP